MGGCDGLGHLGSPPLELIPFEMGGSVDFAFPEMDCDADWKFPLTGSVGHSVKWQVSRVGRSFLLLGIESPRQHGMEPSAPPPDNFDLHSFV